LTPPGIWFDLLLTSAAKAAVILDIYRSAEALRHPKSSNQPKPMADKKSTTAIQTKDQDKRGVNGKQ